MYTATVRGLTVVVERLKISSETMIPTAEDGIAYANLTPRIQRIVVSSGIAVGRVFAFVRHTTAMLIIQEDEEGLARRDLPRAFRRLFPKGLGVYAHDRPERLEVMPGEPVNGDAHCIAALCGKQFFVIPVLEGVLALGTWQSALLFDLDVNHHAEREIVVVVQGA